MTRSDPRGATAVAAALLAAVLAVQAVIVRDEAAYLSVLLLTGAALGAVAAVRLGLRGCFAARFTLVLVAALVLVGEGLLTALGLPGLGHAGVRAGLALTGSAAMTGAVVVLLGLRPKHDAGHPTVL